MVFQKPCLGLLGFLTDLTTNCFATSETVSILTADNRVCGLSWICEMLWLSFLKCFDKHKYNSIHVTVLGCQKTGKWEHPVGCWAVHTWAGFSVCLNSKKSSCWSDTIRHGKTTHNWKRLDPLMFLHLKNTASCQWQTDFLLINAVVSEVLLSKSWLMYFVYVAELCMAGVNHRGAISICRP